LEFTGGTVAAGQTAQFLFSVTVPADFNSNFEIDERPFEQAASAVPTPAALPAMIAFGAGLLRKRRQNKAEVA
jgi:MYXO-CTERM domain-containing protein